MSVSDQNEELFSRGINYSKENPMHRKGTILLRSASVVSTAGKKKPSGSTSENHIQQLHVDMTGAFWGNHVFDLHR
jgi:tRNA(His) 5'-end guanylyltransferase